MKARFNRNAMVIRQRIRIPRIRKSRRQVINAGKFNVVQSWAKKERNPAAYVGLDQIRGCRKKAREGNGVAEEQKGVISFEIHHKYKYQYINNIQKVKILFMQILWRQINLKSDQNCIYVLRFAEARPVDT